MQKKQKYKIDSALTAEGDQGDERKRAILQILKTRPRSPRACEKLFTGHVACLQPSRRLLFLLCFAGDRHTFSLYISCYPVTPTPFSVGRQIPARQTHGKCRERVLGQRLPCTDPTAHPSEPRRRTGTERCRELLSGCPGSPPGDTSKQAAWQL